MSKPVDLPNDVEALKALLVASEDRNLRKQDRIGECHELCVSGLAHAGFRYSHALKRSSNIMAK